MQILVEQKDVKKKKKRICEWVKKKKRLEGLARR